MNEPIVTLDTFALQLEEALRQQCAARGVEFSALKQVLFLKWFSGKEEQLADSGRSLLDKAFACKKLGDDAGYRAACLAYLKAEHDLEIGDSVELGTGRDARTVLIEDFTIGVFDTNLQLSRLSFWGRCTSHKMDIREFWVHTDDPIAKVAAERQSARAD